MTVLTIRAVNKIKKNTDNEDHSILEVYDICPDFSFTKSGTKHYDTVNMVYTSCLTSW